MHRLLELVRLHRMGLGVRDIARQLKMSPNTERTFRRALDPLDMLKGDPEDLPSLQALKAVVAEHLPSKTPPQQTSSIEPFRPRVEALMKKGAGPKAIYDKLTLGPDPASVIVPADRPIRQLVRGLFFESSCAVSPVSPVGGACRAATRRDRPVRFRRSAPQRWCHRGGARRNCE